MRDMFPNKLIVYKLFLLILCLTPSILSSATVIDIHVEEFEERYNMYVEAVIDANVEQVKQVINDYEQLHRINPEMVESKLLSRASDGTAKVSLLTRSCILFFCYNLRHVQNIQNKGPYKIVGQYIPELSDFRYGRSSWTIAESKKADADSATLLIINLELEPDFFIIPIIGPYQLKQKLISVTKMTITNLEAAAILHPIKSDEFTSIHPTP